VELAGRHATVKITGNAVPYEGLPTTSIAGNFDYQITDAAKRIQAYNVPMQVHVRTQTAKASTTGTTTTTIRLTAHGLNTGDLVVNTTRSTARIVTKVDANTLTVAEISGQTVGDLFDLYPTVTTGFELHPLEGLVRFETATTRVVRVTGAYLPVTTLGYAHEYTRRDHCDLHDVSKFGDTFRRRLPGILTGSGTLSDWDVESTYFSDKLEEDDVFVIEFVAAAGVAPVRCYAYIESNELRGAITGVQDSVVSFITTKEFTVRK
jgi:hypothetical protein